MTNLFRVLHIFFASMVIALLPVAIILRQRMAKTKGTPAELTTMGIMLWLGRTMGMVGAIGILLTGATLTGIESYKWFAFAEFPWLATKQLLFVLILIINFALVLPAAKKLAGMIPLAAHNGSGATDEMRAIGAKIGMYSLAMNLLTLTAMTLGASKGIF